MYTYVNKKSNNKQDWWSPVPNINHCLPTKHWRFVEGRGFWHCKLSIQFCQTDADGLCSPWTWCPVVWYCFDWKLGQLILFDNFVLPCFSSATQVLGYSSTEMRLKGCKYIKIVCAELVLEFMLWQIRVLNECTGFPKAAKGFQGFIRMEFGMSKVLTGF